MLTGSRKPEALKLVAGTVRADRAVSSVALELVKACPDARDWLPNAHSVKEWNRLALILTNTRLLTQGGYASGVATHRFLQSALS